MASEPNELKLTDYIRDVPDFPKPGILFRDITPLLFAPAAFRRAIDQLAGHFRDAEIDVVAAAEARGFLFAGPLALELDAALVPIRKPGKLPYKTLSFTYELEYGTDTLEIHADAIPPGANVLVVDDLLATGGTIEACCKMVEKAGGKVAGCAFVIELVGLGGARRIARYKSVSLIKYD
jgi:adenine phosphoribosyltransferase